MRKLFTSLLLGTALSALAQTDAPQWNTPGAGNPFIPGYFADPTIRKFGNTYYLYATTDGNGNGYGPAQVWMSDDFQNWTNVTMSWPNTEVVWAPDVMQAPDGTFHYFYCQPCVLHEGTGSTPRGPWKNILGADDAVLVPDRFVHNAITLDGQTFVDDDGSTYIYFGTWGIYEGFGCGVAKLGSDMKSFTDKKLIPNTEVKDFFEAPFVLKRNGIYYFMYSSGSCHDHTYRVQYATSTEGPMGPYVYQGCILDTNADQTVHGPGHHSVLKDGDDYYIVYHRHNNPRSIHGFHRQICIDKLVFTADGHIEKVVPTHGGLLPKSVAGKPKMQNLAYGAKVKASSSYSDWFRAEYATDDNNATLWKPATCNGRDYIEIDLGRQTTFDQVWTQFEYATYYYQYLIETSNDGKQWTLYADKQHNTLAASPYVDRLQQTARYLRITVTGRQKNGHFGGIWNVKVFNGANQVPPQQQVAVAGGQWLNTAGMLGGGFTKEGGTMVSTFDTGFLFAKRQPYSIVYQQQGQTVAYISDGKIQQLYIDGQLKGKSKKQWGSRLTVDADITNLRVFSYALQPAEISYYAQHPVEQAKPDVNPQLAEERMKKGNMVVNITATNYAIGSSVTDIDNLCGGRFHSDQPLQVELCQGRQAFRFTGSQLLRSDFPLPQTLYYSAPYTVEAWVLNPQVERNECIVQLMPVRNDLSTVELCNGSDPQNGLVMHNGTFENSGAKQIVERQGQWQHWVITYDGYMERHYLDGQLVNEKNMMLLLRPQRFMQIGASFDGSNAFDGYLHQLRVYDRTLSAEEIAASYRQPSQTNALLLLQAADCNGQWTNQGRWGGSANAVAEAFCGKMALTKPVVIEQMKTDARAASASIAFALKKGTKKATLLSTPALQLGIQSKGLTVNGQLLKTPFAAEWNLLTITDNAILLNGVTLSETNTRPLLEAIASPLNVGGNGLAIAQLIVSAKTVTTAEAIKAFQTLSAKPTGLSPTLRAEAITPTLVRLSLDGELNSQASFRFTNEGEWSREPQALIALEQSGQHSFCAIVKDTQGNVAQTNSVSLTVDESLFRNLGDQFDDAALNQSWKTVTGSKARDTKATVENGKLTLQSANGNFNARADDNAILLCREVKGNFVAEVRLDALMGSERQQTPSYNEGGLMVLDDSRPDDQQIVQLGVFPNYNCGNMLTTVSHHGMRPQQPMGNGWQYDPWLQIERRGNMFHLRTSKDGRHWNDMPGSPVQMDEISTDKPVKVGLFQVTYTDKLGTATFDDFRLWHALPPTF